MFTLGVLQNDSYLDYIEYFFAVRFERNSKTFRISQEGQGQVSALILLIETLGFIGIEFNYWCYNVFLITLNDL